MALVLRRSKGLFLVASGGLFFGAGCNLNSQQYTSETAAISAESAAPKVQFCGPSGTAQYYDFIWCRNFCTHKDNIPLGVKVAYWCSGLEQPKNGPDSCTGSYDWCAAKNQCVAPGQCGAANPIQAQAAPVMPATHPIVPPVGVPARQAITPAAKVPLTATQPVSAPVPTNIWRDSGNGNSFSYCSRSGSDPDKDGCG